LSEDWFECDVRVMLGASFPAAMIIKQNIQIFHNERFEHFHFSNTVATTTLSGPALQIERG
jgi:hypothetical protein